MIFRKATLADTSPITELSGQLGYPSSTEKMQERLQQMLGNDDHCIYVCEQDAKVTGWIHAFYSLTVESDPCVEIAGLVVDETQRSKGIGRMLIGKVAAWAREKKISRIRVRSRMTRKETHRFYLKNGFTEIKDQKVFDLPLDQS